MKKPGMILSIGAAIFFVAVLSAAFFPQEAKQKPDQSRGRGHVPPTQEVLRARHAEAAVRHNSRMKALPTALPAAFDCRDGGYMPEIDDQGQCGSCHLVSGADVCEIAMMKAGVLKPMSGGLAKQYGMDCHPVGGCNGGDEYETIKYIRDHGYPLTTDYYPYEARSRTCRAIKNNGKLYQIKEFGFCTPSQEQGVASTQDMKNAIYQYGPISVAFDAAGTDGYNGGVMRGRGNNVDHAVICCGWKTEGGKTIFLGRNQWSKDWGIAGYFWIEEGSYSWGTEAMWVSVVALPPVPDPTPDPTPVPVPTPGAVTFTLSKALAAGKYEILPSGSLAELKRATNEAIDKAIGGNANVEVTPAKMPTGPVSSLEQRMDKMESNFDRLLKLLESKNGKN